MDKLSNNSPVKHHRIFIGFTRHVIIFLFLLALFLLLSYLYVFGFNPPINFTVNEVMAKNEYSSSARIFMAKRWNLALENVMVKSYTSNQFGTHITVLDTKGMAQAEIFYPSKISDLTKIFDAHIFEANPPIPFSIPNGSGYILNEFIPSNEYQKLIIRNYYSGKYFWIGGIRNDLIIKPHPKGDSLGVGNAYYSVIFGLPINFEVFYFN